MATFQRIVDRSSLVITRERKDDAAVQPYVAALQALLVPQVDAAGKPIDQPAGLAGIAPADRKAETSLMRRAARKLNVALRLRFQADGTEMVYWIDPAGKVPERGSWSSDARQAYAADRKAAKAQGLTVKEYRALKTAAA